MALLSQGAGQCLLPRLAQLRVLVVNDDSDTVESTTLMLQGDGHGVATTKDTLHTLIRAMSFRPELVLLDLSVSAF